jgi:hypothetical protein
VSTRPLQRVHTEPLRPVVDFEAARPRVRRSARRRRFWPKLRLRVRRKDMLITLVAIVLACLIAPWALHSPAPTALEVAPLPAAPRLLH